VLEEGKIFQLERDVGGENVVSECSEEGHVNI